MGRTGGELLGGCWKNGRNHNWCSHFDQNYSELFRIILSEKPRKKRQHPPSKSCEQLKCGLVVTLFDNLPAGLRRFGLFCVVFFFGTSLLKVQLPPPPQKPSKKGFFLKKKKKKKKKK